jgi:hypothetical protein
MIRKFGFEVVYRCVEDNEDGKKVLMNIKKRREHAKKKKQSAAEDLGEDVLLSGLLFQIGTDFFFLLVRQIRHPSPLPGQHLKMFCTVVKAKEPTVKMMRESRTQVSHPVLDYGRIMTSLWIYLRELPLLSQVHISFSFIPQNISEKIIFRCEGEPSSKTWSGRKAFQD